MTRIGTPVQSVFDEDTLFRDPQKTHEEATQDHKIKKESIASNSEVKPLGDEEYPFKRINEDIYESNGFMEGDLYEPRGIDSLRYHYPENKVQYILRRHREQQAMVEGKEIIDLTSDSD